MFKDRFDAARQLLPALKKYKDAKDALILAIPRGALQLGSVLRDELHLPLDIIVTKKISAPNNEEYAIGAVDPDGHIQINESMVMQLDISPEYLQEESDRLRHIIRRRYESYHGDSTPPDLKNKTVILVDDGIATGFTVLAAIEYIRRQTPKKVILACPVAAKDSYEKIYSQVDEIICLEVRDDFHAVGQFYQNFPQVEDNEAISLFKG